MFAKWRMIDCQGTKEQKECFGRIRDKFLFVTGCLGSGKTNMLTAKAVTVLTERPEDSVVLFCVLSGNLNEKGGLLEGATKRKIISLDVIDQPTVIILFINNTVII